MVNNEPGHRSERQDDRKAAFPAIGHSVERIETRVNGGFCIRASPCRFVAGAVAGGAIICHTSAERRNHRGFSTVIACGITGQAWRTSQEMRHQCGTGKTKPPYKAAKYLICLVAGTGFEPVTFRL